MSQSSEPFGTITSSSGLHKIGLVDDDPPVVKPVQKRAVTKWTVQNVDNEKDFYRLYASDGKRDYALRTSDDGTRITAFEAGPSSMKSHVWFIPHLTSEFFAILDPATIRGWRVNGTAVELAEPPSGEDGIEPFKFKFSFSG